MTPSGAPTGASLWWPGDHRAGPLMSDAALLDAMVAVEQAWLDALVGAGIAPADAVVDLGSFAINGETLALAAEAGGNPVIPLVATLREAAPEPAATWLHRGLTSQDVLDTAVMLCARDAVGAVRRDVAAQAEVLARLAAEHRTTAMVARTLTQPAVPTTFGAKVATWLHGVLDADEQLAAVRWPVQCGGAGGTLAAPVELAGLAGARAMCTSFAASLGLEVAPPWHTRRTPITRLGDVAVTATDAWGHIANDVLTLGRPEIGEVRDASAGGSSAMPHKANPTLAVLIRRAALVAPQRGATLHLAAAAQVDERADGGWHAEWHGLATLLRHTVVAASQTTDLLRGLEVDTSRMAAHLADVADDVLAEQRATAALVQGPTESDPAHYLGLVDDLVDQALARAEHHRATSQEDPS